MRNESVHPDTFKGANKKFRKINWRELANKQVNKVSLCVFDDFK